MHGMENVGKKGERKRLGNSVPWSRIFSRESDSHLTNQTFPVLLLNSKFRYRVCWGPQLVHIDLCFITTLYLIQ